MAQSPVVLKYRSPDKNLAVVLEDFKKAINRLIAAENDRAPAVSTAHEQLMVLGSTCPWMAANAGHDAFFNDGLATIGAWIAGRTEKLYVDGNVTVENSSAAPKLLVSNKSATARDPVVQFAVGLTPTTLWTLGLDDSDSDSWKISAGTALGTNDVLRLTSAKWVGLNESSNVLMTAGLTINQGSADDEILAFKSSDVTHYLDGDAEPNKAEIDTFGNFQKASSTLGGLLMRGYSEGVTGLSLYGLGRFAAMDATKSSAGVGIVRLIAGAIVPDSSAEATPPADSNLVSIGYGGISPATVWIADVEGDTWQSGIVTATRGQFNISTGTAPLIITSTTLVSNLNADLLDGNHAAAFAPVGAKYIVQEADATLSTEQSLGALATGILLNTTTAGVGVLSIATGANLPSHTHAYEPALGNPGVDGYILSSTILGVRSWVAPAAGGGEVNTASNVGSAGVGLFKQKATYDLEFYKIHAKSSKISVALSGTDYLDLDVEQANIDHDQLTNFAAGEHFLQTAIDHVSTALTTGLLKVTTGTGALTVITDASSNWDAAYGWGNHASGGYLTSVTAHALLSATHNDTTAAGPTRGDLIIAVGATPKWQGLADVAAGAYLRSGGIGLEPLWSTLLLPNAGTAYRLPVFSAANVMTELAAVGATGEYLAGATGAIPAWATLTKEAVAGLKVTDSPAFENVIAYSSLQAIGNAGVVLALTTYNNTPATYANTGFNRARGTSVIPVDVEIGDITGSFFFNGWRNSAWRPSAIVYSYITARGASALEGALVFDILDTSGAEHAVLQAFVNRIAIVGYTTLDGGLHVGGTADPGDNNLTVDGTLIVGSLAGLLKGTAGTVSAITATTAADFLGGDFALHTLNQAAVAGLTTTSNVTHNSLVATAGFGCNSKTAQTAYASGGAVDSGTVDATYGASERDVITSLRTIVNNLRAALIANGICS